MKKALLILMIAAIALCAVGCSKESDNTSTEPATEAGTQLHVIPPSDAISEPEWAPVDCDITLQSDTMQYADSAGILTFALVGSTDEDCELRFSLDEAVTAALSAGATDCFFTVNGERLNGTVTFNDACTEATLKGGYSYEETCKLANTIRGFSE